MQSTWELTVCIKTWDKAFLSPSAPTKHGDYWFQGNVLGGPWNLSGKSNFHRPLPLFSSGLQQFLSCTGHMRSLLLIFTNFWAGCPSNAVSPGKAFWRITLQISGNCWNWHRIIVHLRNTNLMWYFFIIKLGVKPKRVSQDWPVTVRDWQLLFLRW